MKSITPERWREIEPFLNEALGLPAGERRGFLERSCPDPKLRAEIQALLDSDLGEQLLPGAIGELAPTLVEEALPPASRSSDDSLGSDGGRYVPGTMLGSRYRIVSLVGRGGMGEVYRADDLKIRQAVALKFLPSEIERRGGLDRFLAEVRLARQISHPNVARVYDVGEADGLHFLSMEYVDGEDLSSLLRRIGRLPAPKAIQIGHQLAAGLAAAHDAGVLHRDLKPANVMLDGRGRAKIMDFGLAVTSGDAAPGEALAGTPAYMAPEQLAKAEVSEKTDLYSLGLLLFEAAVGSEVLRAKQAQGPETLAEVDPEVPSELAEIIGKCLAPTPEARFDSAKELAGTLRAIAPSSPSTLSGVEPPIPAKTGDHRWLTTVGLVLAAAIAAFALGSRLSVDETQPPPRIRTLTFSGEAGMPSVSPDGQTIAFMSGRDGSARIWLKQIIGGEAPLSEGRADIYPDFSPDGSTVAFMRFGEAPGPPTIYRKPVIGGRSRPVIEYGGNPAWSPNGEEIAFFRRRLPDGKEGLYVVAAEGGDPTELYRDERVLDHLKWSVSGRLAFLAYGVGRSDEVLILDRDSGAVQELALTDQNEFVSGLDWGPDGELVFVTAPGGRSAPGLLQSYDLKTKTRRPIAWIEGGSELGQLDVRGDSVVFDLIASFQNLSEVSAGGSSQSLSRGPTFDRQPVVSPDGRHLLFSSHRSGAMDLWLRERGSGVLTQLTFDDASDMDPSFTADGAGILWSSDREQAGVQEIWTAQLDGTGARRLSNDGVDAQNPSTWPGGDWIVYASYNAEHPGIWKMRPDGADPQPVASTKNGRIPEVSPDGRWVAFIVIGRGTVNYLRVADLESGDLTSFEIEVPKPRPGPGSGSLGRARWSPDGSTLFFLGQNDAGDNGLYRQMFHPTRDTSDTREEVLSSEGGVRILETFDLTPEGGYVLSHLTPTSVIKIAEGVFGPSEER